MTKRETSDKSQKELQDYLDTLLMQGTESEDAQLPSMSEEAQRFGGSNIRPLTTSIMESRPARRKSDRQSSSVLPLIKPYAEPVQPLKFDVPLADIAEKPAVKQAPVIDNEPKETKTPNIKSPAAEVPVTPTVNESDSEPVAEVRKPIATAWCDNGRPEWAQERFECLLFSVGGLTLAVPLVELGSIYKITEELTPLFGQADWFMGLLPVKDNNLRVVNTAKVVMPERYSDVMETEFKYVISINGVDWCLSVDEVSEAITLDPEAVRWRTGRSKRPWLAGTVIDQMCALLDISQLSVMFHRQDKNLRH